MALKKLAAFAALVALATPTLAADPFNPAAGNSTMFYVSIPLDYSLSKKQQQWSAGLQLQGKREYQAVNIDSSMLNFLPMGGIEAKWVVAGVVAVGAAAAVASKDKSTSSSIQQQQAANPAPTPVTCPPVSSCGR